MADLLDLVPEAAVAWAAVRASTPPEDERYGQPAVRAWVEQFGADVSGLGDAHRAALASAVGDGQFDVVAGTWARDMAARLDAALVALTGTAPAWPDGEAGPLWPAIDAFLPAVARLTALDPVTTELVRLRGARANACRLCCSRRSVDAVAAGASHDTFDAVDRYETSDLPEAQKVALRLTDAVLWTPQHWPDDLAEQVHAHFQPSAAVELVLDVVRNGANRIAVALDADAPEVGEGVQWFAIDGAGELAYGLPDPTST